MKLGVSNPPDSTGRMERKMETEWIWVKCGDAKFETKGICDQITTAFKTLKGVFSYQPIFAPKTHHAYVHLEIKKTDRARANIEAVIRSINNWAGCELLCPWAIVPQPDWVNSFGCEHCDRTFTNLEAAQRHAHYDH